MNRVTSTILLFSGIMLLLYGFLLQNTLTVQAQADDEREYMGLRECNDCHRDLSNQHELSRHGMTLLEVEADAEPDDLGFVLGDFTVGEDVRTVAFPDGERAFELADIAFTLGAGANHQAYVVSLDDDVYAVLPAMWDVHESAWIPYNRADTWPDPAYDFGSQCAGCHTVGLSFDEEDGIYQWEEEGVQCEACHGPGSLHVDLVDDIGFDMTGEQYHEIAAALDNPTNVQVCGSCHVRGLDDDGIHPYPFTHGEDLLASYSLVAEDDSDFWYAEGYASQTTMQYNEWLTSRHAASLDTVLDNSAAETACLMCHSGLYSVAHRTLIAGDISDPQAFALAPLILQTFEESGLPPSKQQLMLELWLPMVMSAMSSDEVSDVPLEDILFELFDLIDFDEDDYDPETALLPQFMPYLGTFVYEAQEDAFDGDPDDLEEVTALMQPLIPFVLEDILSQQLPIAEALDADIASHPTNFSVSCVSCHEPHPNEIISAEIEPDAFCTSCHQGTTITETLHHPVKEMFEGQTMVDAVAGIPSTHFAEADGPDCTSCHMSDVLMGDGTMHANHTWNPIIPSSEPDALPSACSGCHTDLSADDLRSLIEDTQSSIEFRLSLAWARVGSIEVPEDDAEAAARYEQAVQMLTFIQNDGSTGVHNYAYADALLDTASDLLSQLSVPGSNLDPTEAPAPTATASADSDIIVYRETAPALSVGMRPITYVIIGGTGLIVLLGAWFIYRRARRMTTSEQDN